MILLSLLLFYYYCFILLLLLFLLCYYCFNLLVLLFYYYFSFHFILLLFSLLLLLFCFIFYFYYYYCCCYFYYYIFIVLLPVRYSGAIVIHFSYFGILCGCSTLCWTMIQSCDYEWISIVMDCIYSVWGSLKLASKCQKPVVVTLLVWHLVVWGVLSDGLGCAAK